MMMMKKKKKKTTRQQEQQQQLKSITLAYARHTHTLKKKYIENGEKKKTNALASFTSRRSELM